MARIGKYSGAFQPLWRYCSFLEESTTIDDDKEHWELRAYLIAKAGGIVDQKALIDKQCGDLPLLMGLMLRAN